MRLDIRQPRKVSKFRKSARRTLAQPRIFLRARKLYRPKKVGTLERIPLVPGLNQWETRVYYALLELRIRFTTQTSLGGGSLLGGARADFLLPDYGIDLEVAGPFHSLSAGKARDALRNLTIRKAGYRVVVLELKHLSNLKQNILAKIGAPIGRLAPAEGTS